MDRELYDEVMQALDESVLAAGEVRCVHAAVAGEEAVDALLNGEEFECRPPVPAAASAQETWLTHIAVQGFRGVGPRSELSIDPKPGLTVVLGRNGTGKSSLAEGLEVVLGGLDDSQRWDGRENEKEWRQGWRNLGWKDDVYAEAGFSGPAGKTVARRFWKDGDEASESCENIDGAWSRGVTEADPVLTYAELGRLPDTKPTERYRQLAHLLGLEGVGSARSLLAKQRIAVEGKERDLNKARKKLDTELTPFDDERARRAQEALALRGWSHRANALKLVLDGENKTSDEGELARLKALVRLNAPADPINEATELRKALEQQRAVQGTAQARLDQLAKLLGRALDYAPETEPSDCPVCATPAVLDPIWRAEAQVRKQEAEALSLKARTAQARLKVATTAAQRLCVGPDVHLERDDRTGPCLTLWRAWEEGERLTGDALLAHLENNHRPLAEAVEALVAEATTQLSALDEAWRPVRARLQGLYERAVANLEAKERAKPFGRAEDWLKQLEKELRERRLKPISERSQDIWETLRHDSSVELDDLVLGGSTTNPTLDLTATIDGHAANALAVMSQGELNALSLALFLPRATQDSSPFRFVVVDDPVQAMDPHKVDGLAKLLHELARDRQIIVFSHDYRLGEALRRLNLKANLVSVQRREQAEVVFQSTGTPVETYLDEVQLAMSEGRVSDEVTRQVVPGLLRMALEAHFSDHVRRRELETRSHAEVNELLGNTKGLVALAALAVGGEPELADWLPNGTDGLLAELATGAHEGTQRKLTTLVRHSTWLLERDLP
ncbi:MAG: AAA family ATPase [Proteobacteria bacterium]|nr:AAA family ATPase [Pseudomonadota bacterium]MCP4916677.1 AAA family ATPase [Pseudomonadota bacterium]